MCVCVCLKVSVVELSAVKGVVDVCAPWRVHAAHSQAPQVLSLLHVLKEKRFHVKCKVHSKLTHLLLSPIPMIK